MWDVASGTLVAKLPLNRRVYARFHPNGRLLAAIGDPTLVDTSLMRIDVETSGQFTRGETVANRHGTRALAELLPGPDGPRYAYTGKTETVGPNAAVAVDVHADRFLDLLLSRIRAK